MRWLWHGNWNCDISFVQEYGIGHTIKCEQHPFNSEKSLSLAHSTDTQSRMLQALKQDELGFRMWNRLICNIRISRDGTEGLVLLRSTDKSCWAGARALTTHASHDSIVRFDLSSSAVLRIRECSVSSLDTIPIRLQKRILLVALTGDAGTVAINVEKDDPASLLQPTRLLINHQLRKDLSRELNVGNWFKMFEFTIHATKGMTSWFESDALKKWMCFGSTRVQPHRGRFAHRSMQTKGVKICIKFDTSEGCHDRSLSSFQVDAMPLILTTSHLSATASKLTNGHDRVVLEITACWRMQGGQLKSRSHTISLRDLRARVRLQKKYVRAQNTYLLRDRNSRSCVLFSARTQNPTH